MVKLRWLQVNKFRSVKPGTRLDFYQGYNVLLGQNGTGKTTLLNLVAAAVSLDFSDLKDTEFDISFELASDKGSAILSIRNEHHTHFTSLFNSLLFNIDPLALGTTAVKIPFLHTKATFSGKSPSLEITLRGVNASAQTIGEQSPPPPIKLKLPETVFSLPTWMQLASSLSNWSAQTNAGSGALSEYFALCIVPKKINRFDESLEHFNKLTDIIISLSQHPDGHITSTQSTEPNETTEALINLARQKWGEDRYVIKDSALPFLQKTILLLGFESAEATIELKESTQDDVDPRMLFGSQKFFFKHRAGWKISEKHLSYGQKRILAFMHYLAAIKNTVIADELVNGLHHSWIDACIEALGDRQAFLTSQNPLLLDYLTFESPEEVRTRFVLCSWAKDSDQMVWENMSQEAAEDFFSSYKVGFQQVGELLQSKGLW